VVGARPHAGEFEVLGVEPLRAATRDDDLMGAIDRLGRRLGVGAREVNRVAVSVGPGGFTGVRIAVATAKIISEATGATVVGVPTAEGVVRALDLRDRAAGPVIVCLAWKRMDVWRTLFQSGASPGSGELIALSRLFEGVADSPTLVLDAQLEERLRALAVLPAQARIVRPRFDPVAIARASLEFPEVDPLALAPLYPREPEAVTKWRELGRGV
jgi:tRNA threonylcarbamoyl adenosine modification protein YeaZ